MMHLLMFAQIDPENANALVKMLLDLVQSGNIAGAVAVGVMLLVLVFRKVLVPWLSPRFPVLLDKRIVIGVTVALSLAVTFGTALVAGAPVTVGLVVTALIGAAGASGIWSMQKNARDGEPLSIPVKSGTVLSAVIGREPGQPMRGAKGPNP